MTTSKTGSAVNAKSAERIGTAESPSNRSGRRPHVAAVRPTHGANSATTIWGNTVKADTASEDECPSERASGSLTCGRIEAFASWKRRRQGKKADILGESPTADSIGLSRMAIGSTTGSTEMDIGAAYREECP